jgi:RNA polymerase sigma-70 factor (ECF subfamily)
MSRSVAFTELVERHDRSLRALAFRLLGDRDRMDDALQEAYARAYRALPRFRGRSAAGTWLYRIVYNACVDELRRERPERRLPLDAVEEGSAPDPSDVATGRAALAAALAALPLDQRAAVLLVDAQGFDYASAAEILGVRVGTLASRLNRARASLREALEPTSEGAETR